MRSQQQRDPCRRAQGEVSLTGSRAASIRRFIADESGLTAVEFGVLSCVMAMVVVSFASSGLSFVGLFRRIALLAGVLVGDEEAPVRPDH